MLQKGALSYSDPFKAMVAPSILAQKHNGSEVGHAVYQVKFMVQTHQMQKWHENAHYCADSVQKLLDAGYVKPSHITVAN